MFGRLLLTLYVTGKLNKWGCCQVVGYPSGICSATIHSYLFAWKPCAKRDVEEIYDQIEKKKKIKVKYTSGQGNKTFLKRKCWKRIPTKIFPWISRHFSLHDIWWYPVSHLQNCRYLLTSINASWLFGIWRTWCAVCIAQQAPVSQNRSHICTVSYKNHITQTWSALMILIFYFEFTKFDPIWCLKYFALYVNLICSFSIFKHDIQRGWELTNQHRGGVSIHVTWLSEGGYKLRIKDADHISRSMPPSLFNRINNYEGPTGSNIGNVFFYKNDKNLIFMGKRLKCSKHFLVFLVLWDGNHSNLIWASDFIDFSRTHSLGIFIYSSKSVY